MEVSQDHWNEMLAIVIVLPGWASHGSGTHLMPAKAHLGHTRTVWRPRRDLLKLINHWGGVSLKSCEQLPREGCFQSWA